MARGRRKRHIPERMERCHERWFDEPTLNKGKWREMCNMPIDCRLFLEVGCGKGDFCTQMAIRNPDVLYIALEKDPSVILAAIEKAHELELQNIFFIRIDAQELTDLFSDDEVSEMFINFCDPWTRNNKPKRRLTYREFLKVYKIIMVKGGKINFKTDNDILFDFSLEEFKEEGFILSELTYDLHRSEFDKDNIRTEFETKFSDAGVPIKHVVATY